MAGRTVDRDAYPSAKPVIVGGRYEGVTLERNVASSLRPRPSGSDTILGPGGSARSGCRCHPFEKLSLGTNVDCERQGNRNGSESSIALHPLASSLVPTHPQGLSVKTLWSSHRRFRETYRHKQDNQIHFTHCNSPAVDAAFHFKIRLAALALGNVRAFLRQRTEQFSFKNPHEKIHRSLY
ncbi:MAG: hypothetical protein ACTHN2_17540 [Nitrobacter sp.]